MCGYLSKSTVALTTSDSVRISHGNSGDTRTVTVQSATRMSDVSCRVLSRLIRAGGDLKQATGFRIYSGVCVCATLLSSLSLSYYLVSPSFSLSVQPSVCLPEASTATSVNDSSENRCVDLSSLYPSLYLSCPFTKAR